MEKKSDIVSIVSGIMFVVSFIADASGVLDQFKIVLNP